MLTALVVVVAGLLVWLGALLKDVRHELRRIQVQIAKVTSYGVIPTIDGDA